MKRGYDCWLQIHQASKHFGGRKLFKLKNNVGTKTNGNYLAMNVGWKLEEVAMPPEQ